MTDRDEALAKAERDHGLSAGAVRALWDALARGGGRMAQFSHPDLGGMGQWSGGGMIQIGDMLDHGLKAQVAAACADLAAAAAQSAARRAAPSGSRQSQWQDDPWSAPAAAGEERDWWPGDLGRPDASGAQSGSRYAYFTARRRLAIERDGRVTLYDTGRHRIFGVSQAQSHGANLAFTGEDGAVDVGSLRVVEG